MRQRPHAFLRIGNRWINMAMVTDIEEQENQLIVYMASDMARLAGREDPAPIDVARRVLIEEEEEVAKVRRWLMLNDED